MMILANFLALLMTFSPMGGAWAAPFPFAFWKTTTTACTGWPCGTLGDLTVGAGVTTTLDVGTSYDYENVTIASTGRLIFRFVSGVESDKGVALGVHGNLVLNGSIEGVFGAILGNASIPSLTAPDGYVLTHTSVSGIGGDGGSDGATGGNQTGDVGGGGGGTVNATPGDGDGNGGNGGEGTLSLGGTAGVGGLVWGSPGTDGGNASGSVSVVSGGSGAGGALGYQGQAIYLKVFGTASGTGSMLFNGRTGGIGGVGGNANNSKVSGVRNAFGGGGGGGGAGGSGGKIVARFKNGLPAGWTYDVSGGAGGVGGSGGLANSTGGMIDGGPGLDGTAGGTGTTDLATY